MRVFDSKKFMREMRKVDDTKMSAFLDETGFAIDSSSVDVEEFEKFFLFMKAERPKELVDRISLEDLVSIGEKLDVIAGVIDGASGRSVSSMLDTLSRQRSRIRRVL